MSFVDVHPEETTSTLVRDPDWWRGAVIYQIYPRSFQDSNGDGIGDLPGIIDRLPHVASLNVDAIWISPFFTSPMLDYGYLDAIWQSAAMVGYQTSGGRFTRAIATLTGRRESRPALVQPNWSV